MPLRKNTLCLIESLVLFLKLPYSVSKQLNSKISKGIINYIYCGIIGSCLHVFSELYDTLHSRYFGKTATSNSHTCRYNVFN